MGMGVAQRTRAPGMACTAVAQSMQVNFSICAGEGKDRRRGQTTRRRRVVVAVLFPPFIPLLSALRMLSGPFRFFFSSLPALPIIWKGMKCAVYGMALARYAHSG